MKTNIHPTIEAYKQSRDQEALPRPPKKCQAKWLKKLAMEAGADDVGIVSINDPLLAEEKQEIQEVMPSAKSLISFVCRLNRENIRCINRAISDTEFLQSFERINSVARKLCAALAKDGLKALYAAGGFPMDMSKWPGKMWPISHKTVATAAGMGVMGLNRLVLHPRFGSFVALNTVLIDKAVDTYDQPLEYSPCIDCKLCAAVCPVGAISPDGHFNFANCMTHNYRDRMGGFQGWVENIVTSKKVSKYRKRVSDKETVSMWQSLSYGICNKSSYCMAACPAGEEVIGDYVDDRKKYVAENVKRFNDKKETIYVTPNSDGAAYVRKRYPHKDSKEVFNGLRPDTIAGFFRSMNLIFQREQAGELDAVFHFDFSGSETYKGTVIIKNKTLEVKDGHVGTPSIRIYADSQTWLDFLAKEKNLLVALVQRKIKIKGSPKLMQAFAKCFSS